MHTYPMCVCCKHNNYYDISRQDTKIIVAHTESITDQKTFP